jgi:tRNA(fMet)-specific endonuclease VapC
MAGVLLDTDVVSYILKGDTRAASYTPHLAGERAWISFMTLAELEQWALAHGWGARRRLGMAEYVNELVVVPSTIALCQRWAQVTVDGQRRGRPIACADAWIAATAVHYRIPLITHNHAHFADISGLRLLLP